jgi:hypothetical protein
MHVSTRTFTHLVFNGGLDPFVTDEPLCVHEASLNVKALKPRVLFQEIIAGRTFLQAHWPALVATDFFTTEVWPARGLVIYDIVFVIEL